MSPAFATDGGFDWTMTRIASRQCFKATGGAQWWEGDDS